MIRAGHYGGAPPATAMQQMSRRTGRKKMTRLSSGVWPSQARPAHDPATRLAGDLTTAEAGIKIPATPVAFYGRTACAAGSGDGQADRYRPLVLCRSVVAACVGALVSGSFDEGCRADRPWPSRPQGQAPLSAHDRPAAALAVAAPRRLLPRCPPAAGNWILPQLALRRVLLVLADTGIPALAVREYDLLGRLMSRPVDSTHPAGRVAWPSASGSRPGGTRHKVRAAIGKPGRGEPR